METSETTSEIIPPRQPEETTPSPETQSQSKRIVTFVIIAIVVLLVLLYVPIVALGGIAALLLPTGGGAIFDRPSSLGMIVVLAVGGIVQMLIYPLFYCVLTVLYYDLRVRKEGFDLELLASSLQSA